MHWSGLHSDLKHLLKLISKGGATVPEKSLERFFEKPKKRKNDTFLFLY